VADTSSSPWASLKTGLHRRFGPPTRAKPPTWSCWAKSRGAVAGIVRGRRRREAASGSWHRQGASLGKLIASHVIPGQAGGAGAIAGKSLPTPSGRAVPRSDRNEHYLVRDIMAAMRRSGPRRARSRLLSVLLTLVLIVRVAAGCCLNIHNYFPQFSVPVSCIGRESYFLGRLSLGFLFHLISKFIALPADRQHPAGQRAAAKKGSGHNTPATRRRIRGVCVLRWWSPAAYMAPLRTRGDKGVAAAGGAGVAGGGAHGVVAAPGGEQPSGREFLVPAAVLRTFVLLLAT
jgi:hypothetical protein